MTTNHDIGGKTEAIASGGWRLWCPKTKDGQTWYVVASGQRPGSRLPISILVKSTDGIDWKEVSEVYSEYPNGEPTMEFLPAGDIVATLRVHGLPKDGYMLGNPHDNTGIATAKPPYLEWKLAHSYQTRLDGATTCSVGGRIFTVGRNHLGPRSDMGNHLARKRTAFYEVKRDELVHLFDLPSNGDTAYTGVVVREDSIYVSYYTGPLEKDYPWLVGICFRTKTDVRIARVSASGLVKYAGEVHSKRSES
ncbi:MAG: hypothetical protein GY866_07605 [Proteobacteria bacterium]|nr:hypothetical protein [Pseudomonadota bacterium]